MSQESCLQAKIIPKDLGSNSDVACHEKELVLVTFRFKRLKMD